MSSISPLPSRRSTSVLMTARMSSRAQHAHGVGRVELEAHVHLHAADGREIVALGIEEQRVEQVGRRLDRRRLAGPHDPVDVHQRLFLIGVLVDVERVADEGPDVDVVDVEDREILDLLLLELGQQLRVELIAGLGDGSCRSPVDDVLGDVATGEVVGGDEHLLEAALGQLTRLARRDLLARLDDHLARLGVGEVGRSASCRASSRARTASSSRASIP